MGHIAVIRRLTLRALSVAVAGLTIVWPVLTDAGQSAPAAAPAAPEPIPYFVADGINGTVLVDTDPSRFASTVANIIGQPEVRNTQGRAGHARLQRELRLDAMIDGFERAAHGDEVMATAR